MPGPDVRIETENERRLAEAERRLKELEQQRSASPSVPTAAPPPDPPDPPAPTASAVASAPPAPSASASASPGDKGFLTVGCSPSCDQILVDNKNRGPSPLTKLALAPGRHELVVVRDMERRTRFVEIKAGKTSSVREKFDDPIFSAHN